MSKHSRVTHSVIEDLRANMQPLSDKCHQDIIEGEDEDAKVVETKVCAWALEKTCKVYAYPDAKWRLGNCNMATHVETESDKRQQGKKRVGQQKQKKKAG